MAEKEKKEECQPWQKAWLGHYREDLVKRIGPTVTDIMDLLIQKGSMTSDMEEYQKIDSLPEARRNKRARLLLNFISSAGPKCFWHFQAALIATGCADLAIMVDDKVAMVEAFSLVDVFEGPASVKKLRDCLKELYRQLEMTSLHGHADSDSISLEDMQVTICLLSCKKLNALCGVEGQEEPFEVGSLASKEGSVIELADVLELDEDGKLAGRQLAVGCAGAGKSSAFMLKAAFEWARRKLKADKQFWKRIVLFLRYDLNDRSLWKAESLEELFRLSRRYGLSRRDEAEVVDFVCQHSDQVLIVLDSLDEAKVEADSLLWRVLRGKCDELPRLNLIVCCRPCETASVLAKASVFHRRLEVVGFTVTEQKIAEFVDAFFSEDPSKSSILQAALRVRPDVRSLMHTPLLATMACRLFELEKDLPSNETQVYKSAVLAMLQQSTEKSGYEAPLSILGEIHPAGLQTAFLNLSKLAFDGLIEKQVVFRKSDLEKAKCVGDAVELGLLSSTPGVSVAGRGEDAFAFRHHTMQEFLAAVHAVRVLVGQKKKSVSKVMEKVGTDGDKAKFWQFMSGLLRGSDCESLLGALSAKVQETEKKLDVTNSVLTLLLLHCHEECLSELPREGSSAVSTTMATTGIKVVNMYLTMADVRAMSLALRLYSDQVRIVTLQDSSMDPDSEAVLVSGLQQCTRLKLADLSALKSTPGITDIIEQNSETLEALVLHAQDEDVSTIAPSIQKCSRIERFGIGDRSLTSASAPAIGRIMGGFQRLLQFSITGQIEDSGFSSISLELLRHAGHLHRLSLFQTRLSVGALVSMLPSLRNLTAFCLVGNAIGDGGLRDLVPALRRLRRLKRLLLVDVGLMWRSVREVEQLLDDLPHLAQSSVFLPTSSFVEDVEDVVSALQVATMKLRSHCSEEFNMLGYRVVESFTLQNSRGQSVCICVV